MKIIFPIAFTLFFIFIDKNVEENQKNIEGKPFFDFDEVLHYEIPISEEIYRELVLEEGSFEKVKHLQILLENSCPNTEEENIQFETAINSIEKIATTIDSKYYSEFRNKIFSEKKCDVVSSRKCGPIYRDIFIFKKNNKQTGMAKICFECRLYSFSKGNFNSNCFGMNGEFRSLKKIISENKKLK